MRENSSDCSANVCSVCLVLIFNRCKWYRLHAPGDNVVYLSCSWKLWVCSIKKWITKQRSFGNHFSWMRMQTSDVATSCSRILLSFHSSSLSWSCPSATDIVHVFTYEGIAPDLYDRPLTLRVLVHQRQTENTQGHLWAQPNLALCHSVAATSNHHDSRSHLIQQPYNA